MGGAMAVNQECVAGWRIARPSISTGIIIIQSTVRLNAQHRHFAVVGSVLAKTGRVALAQAHPSTPKH